MCGEQRPPVTTGTARELRVLLLGNYAPDAQPSMQRFAALLNDGLPAHGIDVELLRPPPVVGGSGPSASGIAKWLGYVDKYLLFPPRLRREVRRGRHRRVVVHVCDHSNAPYVRWLQHLPHLVTCHDLLAVRTARGEFPGVQTRWTGRQLQRTIVRGLGRARHIVCDSESTRSDVRRLVRTPGVDIGLIAPGLADAFRPIDPLDAGLRVRRVLGASTRGHGYILHVGGNQWYKNRAGVIEIYAALVARRPDAPMLVMAGKPLTAELDALIASRGLAPRVRIVSAVTDEDLAALYQSAGCLLFPSMAEGFGWPVAEAMACGCPVVVSGRAPLTEIGGEQAAYLDPSDIRGAADRLAAVLDEPGAARDARTRTGIRRAARYRREQMVAAYVDCYRGLLDRPRSERVGTPGTADAAAFGRAGSA